jgi:hypothetical protein
MVIVNKLVKWRLAGETEVLGKTLSQHHFVHHKSHMTRPVILPYSTFYMLPTGTYTFILPALWNFRWRNSWQRRRRNCEICHLATVFSTFKYITWPCMERAETAYRNQTEPFQPLQLPQQLKMYHKMTSKSNRPAENVASMCTDSNKNTMIEL